MGCEHNYQVIEDNIDVDEIRFNDGVVNIEIRGYVVFHCAKCLDIQEKVIK